MFRSRIFPVFALTAVVLAPQVAAAAPDAVHGEQLARRWCAACHVVAEDQSRGGDSVPTFSAISKMPGRNAAGIAAFLKDPHAKMPDMQLSTVEAADLAAYIVSLAK